MPEPWLAVAGDFTPLGGMDRANYALARYLASRGTVHLVTHRAPADLTAHPGVILHRVPRPLGSDALGSVLLSREGRRTWKRLSSAPFQAIVNGGNCDVPAINWVHYVHAAYEPVVAGSIVRRVRTALVHRKNLIDERRALHLARLIVCNSRRTRSDVVERIRPPAERVRVVYYGSDPDRFSRVSADERSHAKRALGLDPDRLVAGFAGALGDRRKGFDTLFAAWTELCGSPAWDVDLVVAGEGAERAEWQRRARDAGLGTRIRFTGFHPDIAAVLAALDAFVHPARYEAYGLSVHEALCRGVPSMVTASAGVAEHYPAALADLLIADPNDSPELASRLRRWRGAAGEWRERIGALSDTLRARTWDAMAAEIAALAEHAAVA